MGNRSLDCRRLARPGFWIWTAQLSSITAIKRMDTISFIAVMLETDGYDQFLDGAKEFLDGIADGDLVIFVTSRTEDYAEITERFLRENGVWYDRIIYGAPYGERIVVNDRKPSGLVTAIAVNTVRDEFMQNCFIICDNL